MDELRQRYHAAIESRQRVTDVLFVRDLQRIADIQRHYLNLRRFAKTYLGDFEKSSFAKVANECHQLAKRSKKSEKEGEATKRNPLTRGPIHRHCLKMSQVFFEWVIRFSLKICLTYCHKIDCESGPTTLSLFASFTLLFANL